MTLGFRVEFGPKRERKLLSADSDAVHREAARAVDDLFARG
jgi:hypothetical protein